MKKEINVGAWSMKTLGIKDDRNIWYDAPDQMSDTASDKIKGVLAQFRKGAKVSLTMNESGHYMDVEILELPEITDSDEIVGFEEVLRKAHDKFKDTLSIHTELNQTGETWMATAKVYIGDRLFEAHGDATAENVGEHMRTCMPRFAETRAISRALRLALGEWVPEVLKEKG